MSSLFTMEKYFTSIVCIFPASKVCSVASQKSHRTRFSGKMQFINIQPSAHELGKGMTLKSQARLGCSSESVSGAKHITKHAKLSGRNFKKEVP